MPTTTTTSTLKTTVLLRFLPNLSNEGKNMN